MNRFREELTKVPEEIVKEIQKTTTDWKFGFGVFRDKSKIPFGWPNSDQEFIHKQVIIDKNIWLLNLLAYQDMTQDTDSLIEKITTTKGNVSNINASLLKKNKQSILKLKTGPVKVF